MAGPSVEICCCSLTLVEVRSFEGFWVHLGIFLSVNLKIYMYRYWRFCGERVVKVQLKNKQFMEGLHVVCLFDFE